MPNSMPTATEALQRLIDGNRHFAADKRTDESLSCKNRRAEVADSQEPFAIILGCADSRVPAEIVFDQGVGDLFVVRVAGNIVAPSQIGSVEFAAATFGTPLVVVLGHSRCGAVSATLEELQRPSDLRSPNLKSIVDRIRPSVETLLDTPGEMEPADLLKKAVRANVRAAANQLRHGSAILENLIAEQKLLVVGAKYSLDTGLVDFFDGVPESMS